MRNQIIALVGMQLKKFYREPSILFWAIGFPVIISWLLGIAFMHTHYIEFFIPGVMAMGIMSSCLWGTGWALIDLRMKKMLKRLIITPLPKSVFLMTHLMTRIVISGVEILLLYGFAYLYFHISISIDWIAFWLLFICGNIAFSGIAILVACRANSAIVGNGLLNAVMMPMLFLSGIFFSYQNYPSWMLPILSKLPLSLLADGLRAVMEGHVGVSHVALYCVGLLGVGAVTFGLGIRWFKWT